MKTIISVIALMSACLLIFCSCQTASAGFIAPVEKPVTSFDEQKQTTTSFTAATSIFTITRQTVTSEVDENVVDYDEISVAPTTSNTAISHDEDSATPEIAYPDITFTTPDKVILYRAGKEHPITNSDDIVKIMTIFSLWFPKNEFEDIANLYVEDLIVTEIKSVKAVELLYDTKRAIDTGRFAECDKILIPVEGKYRNLVFGFVDGRPFATGIGSYIPEEENRMAEALDGIAVD